MKKHSLMILSVTVPVLALANLQQCWAADEPGQAMARAGGCQPSSPVAPDLIESWSGDLVINKKMRYISFSADDSGQSQAIKVTLCNLPAPYDIWNGRAMWVGPPDEYSELGSRGFSNPCTLADPCLNGSFMSSELQCDPFYMDWSTVGTVHVRSEAITPSSVYCVQVVDSTCPDDQDASFSDPVSIPTARWGDIAGPFTNSAWSAADGNVTVPFEQFPVFDAFSNLLLPGPLKVRVELVGFSAFGDAPTLDGKITASDIYLEIGTFFGEPYPFTPSLPDLCPGTIYAEGSACPAGPFFCGDGTLNPGEACDDGNLIPGDGCDALCRIESVCGNGVREFDEGCDDGGTVSGDGCSDVCRVEGTAIISVVPNRASSGYSISGNEITLDSGNQRVFLDMYLRNWDPELDGNPLLRGWQVQLDANSYTSGLHGSLTIALLACNDDVDCTTAFGGLCEISHTPCIVKSDCPLDPIERCTGSSCGFLPDGEDLCTPAYIQVGRSDYIFVDTADIPMMDERVPDFRWGSHTQDGQGVADPGAARYLGSLVLDVSNDAAGTFTVGIKSGLTETALIDTKRNIIPFAQFVPALITVNNPLQLGCCMGDETCSDDTIENCILGGGTVVAKCDCNGDLVPDACSGDCNDNGLSDTCEIFDGDELDCNHNRVPDSCDVADQTSNDCDGNGVPDECDTDCNDNNIPDTCDLANMTSADCNTNDIPDECEPDCNGNGVPNDCDITNSTSADVNSNGVPDECECPPADVQPEATVIPKNRHLSFIPGNWGQQTALRVTVTSAPPAYAGLVGISMWVGQPKQVSELGGVTDDSVPPTYTTATLQCTPYFTDWGTLGTIHVYHQNIIPNAAYVVEAIDDVCDQGDPLQYAAPLTVVTPDWSDIVGNFVGGAWEAPDGIVAVLDRVALIDRFASRPGAPSKARADLVPATLDQRIDILDMLASIDAFKGAAYDLAVNTAPCAN